MKGRQYLQHRVAWALHYGEWPASFIDHINHIRDDNRIHNLRVVTRAENNSNAIRRMNYKTGYQAGLEAAAKVCDGRKELYLNAASAGFKDEAEAEYFQGKITASNECIQAIRNLIKE